MAWSGERRGAGKVLKTATSHLGAYTVKIKILYEESHCNLIKLLFIFVHNTCFHYCLSVIVGESNSEDHVILILRAVVSLPDNTVKTHTEVQR